MGLRGNRATVVGEVRWQSGPMNVGILGELDRFKLPALAESGVDVREAEIVLVSRAGFTPALAEAASGNGRIHLVGPDALARSPS